MTLLFLVVLIISSNYYHNIISFYNDFVSSTIMEQFFLGLITPTIGDSSTAFYNMDEGYNIFSQTADNVKFAAFEYSHFIFRGPFNILVVHNYFPHNQFFFLNSIVGNICVDR